MHARHACMHARLVRGVRENGYMRVPNTETPVLRRGAGSINGWSTCMWITLNTRFRGLNMAALAVSARQKCAPEMIARLRFCEFASDAVHGQ